MTRNSTPEVPSDRKASPGLMTPMPAAPAALSPPPPATGTASMPQSAATALSSVPDGVGAFDEARHVRFVEARGGQHLRRPAALADVQPQRAGGVGHLADLLAGHEQADVVLGQQHAARVLEHRRFVLAHPDELGRGEAGHGDVAGDLAGARLGLLERARMLLRCGRRSRGWPGAAACRRRRAAWRRASGPTGPRPSRPCAAAPAAP